MESKGNKTEIKKILNNNYIVVITKKEAKKLDSIHKSTLPENGDRLQAARIQVAHETKDNKLFN